MYVNSVPSIIKPKKLVISNNNILHLKVTVLFFFLEKEHVLKLHPDLAGKLADLGKLTNESAQEQKNAGLDHITPENKEKLCKLNEE